MRTMDIARRDLHIANADKNAKLTEDAFHYIYANPETGFKEWKTHKYLWDGFVALGYEPIAAGNIPGFYVDLDTGRPGPTVAVMGEMDALIVEGHPDADPETGAVHACGHCCQAAALLGLAATLKEPGALDGLCGRIRLMAVPAEELIEVEFREQLRKDGIIRYYGGKTEFMARGLLNGVDMAFMSHTTGGALHCGRVSGGSNGFITKQVTFTGRAAHAGGAPHKGINALYAANQALSAVNALRETFEDDAHIRVHPIITAGGAVVNAIPDRVVMESYLRGATMEAVRDANRKVNRALAGSAAAMGAGVTISDRPGYFPRKHDVGMMELMRDAMEQVMEEVIYKPTSFGTGSSDMGDVSSVMPVAHPYVGGSNGKSHGVEFRILDVNAACVDMVKLHAVALELLLSNEAARAKEIIAAHTPLFASIEEYLRFADSFILDREVVRYDDKGNVILNLGEEEL